MWLFYSSDSIGLHAIIEIIEIFILLYNISKPLTTGRINWVDNNLNVDVSSRVIKFSSFCCDSC